MNRKLKAFGLTFFAVLAMSAVVASAAQATGTFTAERYPAVIKGAQETGGGLLNYFESTDGNKTECTTATYQATLENASHELTVTPHYSGCVAQPNNLTAHVTLNGCHFIFKTSGTDFNGNTVGTADIKCPVGKQIEIHVANNICRVDIPAQTGLTGITFTNKGGSTVTVDVDITNQIRYTDTDLTIFCPFAGTAEFVNGDFISSVTVHGAEDKGLENGPTGANTTYKAGSPVNVHVK